ncbi:hypothetical protein GCM10023238_00670 [Streptomyces heliomycini]
MAAGPRSAFGRPVPRGAWQQVPPYVLVPLLAAIAVLGYFSRSSASPWRRSLAVDVVLGEVAHRRGRRSLRRRPAAR